jgi:hypothetical protein
MSGLGQTDLHFARVQAKWSASRATELAQATLNKVFESCLGLFSVFCDGWPIGEPATDLDVFEVQHLRSLNMLYAVLRT